MKGLFIKDIKLLKNQKSFVFIFGAVILIYLFTDITAMSAIGYATFVGTIFVISTISYDEYDNGNAFLFTLPFLRKDYVREKYLFTLLTGGGLWLLSTAASAICDVVRHPDTVVSDYISASLLIASMFFLIISVMLPIQLKYGGNRGMIAMILVAGAVSLAVYIAAKLTALFGIDILAMFDALQAGSLHVFSFLCLAAAAIGMFLSMQISMRIVEKKEF